MTVCLSIGEEPDRAYQKRTCWRWTHCCFNDWGSYWQHVFKHFSGRNFRFVLSHKVWVSPSASLHLSLYSVSEDCYCSGLRLLLQVVTKEPINSYFAGQVVRGNKSLRSRCRRGVYTHWEVAPICVISTKMYMKGFNGLIRKHFLAIELILKINK